jgi:hypothetical protein
MIRRKGVATVSVLTAALMAAAGLALTWHGGEPKPLPSRPAGERPVLMLVTSLPIMFGESFSIEAAGSPALRALEPRYRVVPIGVTDAASLRQGRLLLMAHPLAQPAEELVALDDWVRAGGRLVLLADPALDWPSKLPLGDRLRPPPMFMDTGLLAHWGLRLDAPDEHGPARREVEGRAVEVSSPGTLVGSCPTEAVGLVVRCRPGKGRATIIADADFMNAGDPGSDNLQFLLAELQRIER